ncbi:MAG: fumarate hydratase [Oscillospiraceae bacterium]|jgi:fumarate hydratase subunit alpha|nr:fumarate hydratase [Oscillospiraceae bacterium]
MARQVSVAQVRDTVRALCLAACREIGDDVLTALDEALARERSPFGREILRQIIENDRLARERGMPLCQDTGMAVVFMDVGQDAHLVGGDLTDAVDAGVRAAYREGCFRSSVLSPLGRVNTGDNTPAVLHLRLVPGDGVEITVAPKGFGSENMSRLGMLTPSQGMRGVGDFVVETVALAGANPCPPVVVGVGIGGTAESAMLLAKRCLLRVIGSPAPDAELAALEAELLARVNALGIGPQGLGGDTTALAVHCAQMPTHIAGLPVAVNMQCHVARHKRAKI